MSSFQAARDRVLDSHPSGGEVDFEESVLYHHDRGARRSFTYATGRALAESHTLLQPRGGVATVAGQIELLRHLAEEGGADVLPLTVDSYTRQRDFSSSDELWGEAERTGSLTLLNGFPCVSAGIENCRKITSACEKPVEARHGSPDARLLAEVAIAGGCTAFEGGAITYCVPYSRDTSIEESLGNWVYVDRLCGEYAKRGVIIEREAFGALTGLLVPPAIAIACSVLELILAAQQGVRSFAVGIGQCGELIQDVAAIRALRKLSSIYLARCLPRATLQLSTVFYQWMGPFPRDEATANAVIALAAVTAAAGRPTRMITKSAEEAHGVPSPESNAMGLRLTRAMMEAVSSRSFVDEGAVDEECYWIGREAECMLEHVLGGEDGRPLGERIVAAFASGRLDVPFAPNRYVQGRVWPERDHMRAIRYSDCGDLPFDRDIRDRNEALLSRRRSRAEGVEVRALAEVASVTADINFSTHEREPENAYPE
jgi:methylaspartate mutase epsilon subunit